MNVIAPSTDRASSLPSLHIGTTRQAVTRSAPSASRTRGEYVLASMR